LNKKTARIEKIKKSRKRSEATFRSEGSENTAV